MVRARQRGQALGGAGEESSGRQVPGCVGTGVGAHMSGGACGRGRLTR